MSRAWTWTQPIWTGISGKALPGENPLIRWTSAGRMWATLAAFAGSVAASVFAVKTGGWLLLVLPPAWLLTVSRVRVMQTGLVHHASHGNLLPNKFWNELVGELNSLLV